MEINTAAAHRPAWQLAVGSLPSWPMYHAGDVLAACVDQAHVSGAEPRQRVVVVVHAVLLSSRPDWRRAGCYGLRAAVLCRLRGGSLRGAAAASLHSE